MVRWHHQLSVREFEQTPTDSGGQRSLECWSPWGRKELDTTQQLKTTTAAAATHVLGTAPGVKRDGDAHATSALTSLPCPAFRSLWKSAHQLEGLACLGGY